MRHGYKVEYNGVRIRPLCEDDLELLRAWRNDTSNSKYLTPIGYVTEEAQKQWFQKYLEDDSVITFAIEDTEILKRMIGSVSIYDFKEDMSNAGKVMIGDKEASGHSFGYRGEALAIHVGFQKCGINKYITEVNTKNVKSMKTAANLGFIIVGERELSFDDGSEYYYRMSREEFYRKNPDLLNVEVMEVE